jgi:hypothetical protein
MKISDFVPEYRKFEMSINPMKFLSNRLTNLGIAYLIKLQRTVPCWTGLYIIFFVEMELIVIQNCKVCDFEDLFYGFFVIFIFN